MMTWSSTSITSGARKLNRGTTVGSLAHADPSGEMTAVLAVLGGLQGLLRVGDQGRDHPLLLLVDLLAGRARFLGRAQDLARHPHGERDEEHVVQAGVVAAEPDESLHGGREPGGLEVVQGGLEAGQLFRAAHKTAAARGGSG